MKSNHTLLTCFLSLIAAAAVGIPSVAPAATRNEKGKYTEFKGTMIATIASNTNWNATYKKTYDVVAVVYDDGNLLVFSPNATYKEGAPYINTLFDSWTMAAVKNISGGSSKDRLYTFKRSILSRSADPFYFAANSVSSKGAPTGFTNNIFNWSSTLTMCDFSTGATVYVTKSKNNIVSIFCDPPPANSSSFYMAQDLLPRYFGGFVKSVSMSLK